MSFSLTIIAAARVAELARRNRVSRSRVVEELIASVDYPQMFALFEAGATLGQIVCQTGQPPAMVRALYAEYQGGLSAPAALPPPSQARRRGRHLQAVPTPKAPAAQ